MKIVERKKGEIDFCGSANGNAHLAQMPPKNRSFKILPRVPFEQTYLG